MTVLAIDPGSAASAYVLWDGQSILDKGKLLNETMRAVIRETPYDQLVIEMVASYGMPVGTEVFETCVWIGRFVEAALEMAHPCHRLPRLAVKQHVCHDSRAKDSNIRQALIDRFGGPASVRKGGALYKVTGDMMSALALAVTFLDSAVMAQVVQDAQRGVADMADYQPGQVPWEQETKP